MRKYIWIAVALVGGFLAGWLIFGFHGQSAAPTTDHADHVHEEGQVWTCSMHPQIRLDAPGDCPICGMDLIPLRTEGGSSGGEVPEGAMRLSAEAVALANVQTSTVSRGEPVREMLLYGVVVPDERSLQSQSAHVGGRVERLLVDAAGLSVQRGQPLAEVYSPELVTAQQELLEALKLADSQPDLLAAAREKLKKWKLTDAQIVAIEASGRVSATVEIAATASGVVTARRVSVGDYVSQGGVLLEIADLSRVWVLFDAYEADLAFLKVGDPVEFTLAAIPGRTFEGRISFIDPMLDATTRTAKVRVEMGNPGGLLKPQMYATGRVSARLGAYRDGVVVPRGAVLWTGSRSIVYVSLPGYDTPVFRLREVELGPSLGNAYVVLSGLEEGEQIVTRGAFAVDAAAQLEGRPSMMNDGASRAATGHEGHGAQPAPAAGGHEGHGVQPAATEHAALRVEGLCDMCKERVEQTALGVGGVASAAWDKSSKQLHLHFDPSRTSLAAVSRALAAAGHDTALDRAPDAVYDALPGCCKYRGAFCG